MRSLDCKERVQLLPSVIMIKRLGCSRARLQTRARWWNGKQKCNNKTKLKMIHYERQKQIY